MYSKSNFLEVRDIGHSFEGAYVIAFTVICYPREIIKRSRKIAYF